MMFNSELKTPTQGRQKQPRIYIYIYIFANYKTNQVQDSLCLPTLVPPLMNFAHNETKPAPAVPKFILLGLSLIN